MEGFVTATIILSIALFIVSIKLARVSVRLEEVTKSRDEWMASNRSAQQQRKAAQEEVIRILRDRSIPAGRRTPAEPPVPAGENPDDSMTA